MQKLFFLIFWVLIFLSACVSQPQNTVEQEPPPIEPVIDLCENVLCNDYCGGETFFHGGACVNGSCSFLVDENSPECGFVPQEKFNLQTDFRECRYSGTENELKLFFTIKNLGENFPARNSSIWVLGDNVSGKVFHVLNDEFGKNQVFWGTARHDTWDYQGQIWTIRNAESAESAGGIKLVLCEGIDFLSETCSVEKGIVLFEGIASELCAK